MIVHTALQFRYGALIAAALRNGTMDQAAVVHARPFHSEVAISCELPKLLKFAGFDLKYFRGMLLFGFGMFLLLDLLRSNE